MKEIVMLDQRIIELNREILAHPELVQKMRQAYNEGDKAHSTIFTAEVDSPDIPVIRNFEQAIGFLAAEVNILLDGVYNYEAICNLCAIIREKLIEKRTVVVNTKADEAKILLPPGTRIH